MTLEKSHQCHPNICVTSTGKSDTRMPFPLPCHVPQARKDCRKKMVRIRVDLCHPLKSSHHQLSGQNTIGLSLAPAHSHWDCGFSPELQRPSMGRAARQRCSGHAGGSTVPLPPFPDPGHATASSAHTHYFKKNPPHGPLENREPSKSMPCSWRAPTREMY